MKVRVTATTLAEALQRAERIGRGGTLLEADRNGLRVEAGDLDKAVTTTVDAEVIEPGTAVVPGDPAARAAATAARFGDHAELVSDGAHVSFTAASFEASVPTVATERIAVSAVSDLPVEVPNLTGALKRVVPAAAPPGRRYADVLAGVRIEAAVTGRLVLVATDSYRMVAATTAANGPIESFGATVPAAPLGELLRGADGGDGELVRIGLADSAVTFAHGGVTLTTRLLAAGYPDWRRLLHDGPVARLVVARRELEAAIDAASAVVGTQPGSRAVIAMYPDRLTVSGRCFGLDGVGATSVEVEATWDGEPGRVVAFPPGKLAAGLDATDGDPVTIEIGPDGKAAVVVGPDSPDVTSVVMPIRLGEGGGQ